MKGQARGATAEGRWAQAGRDGLWTHKRPYEETWDGRRKREADGRTEWSGRREDLLRRKGRREAKQQKKSEAPGGKVGGGRGRQHFDGWRKDELRRSRGRAESSSEEEE